MQLETMLTFNNDDEEMATGVVVAMRDTMPTMELAAAVAAHVVSEQAGCDDDAFTLTPIKDPVRDVLDAVKAGDYKGYQAKAAQVVERSITSFSVTWKDA